ncbi:MULTISPECIES: hypothetical protein [Mycobacteriaceae]|jgi:hypothetical protein|uniref:Uncharacterized protein n=1 Tax=Mycolicibacterium iranicum TaxID=912594 RepID=A0A178LJ84_MYCIR|nr:MULTISPECIES: hypothetical protein [Mycobacteriaceae]OAN31058.1 hypothetical protein A4X20_29355 [Mycolicibacterium iranicum]
MNGTDRRRPSRQLLPDGYRRGPLHTARFTTIFSGDVTCGCFTWDVDVKQLKNQRVSWSR